MASVGPGGPFSKLRVGFLNQTVRHSFPGGIGSGQRLDGRCNKLQLDYIDGCDYNSDTHTFFQRR